MHLLFTKLELSIRMEGPKSHCGDPNHNYIALDIKLFGMRDGSRVRVKA